MFTGKLTKNLEIDISGNTGTIPKHPLLQEGIFGSKRLRTILKQWNFKMKKLCSKMLKSLINELNKPVHKRETSYTVTSYSYTETSTDIEKIEIFHACLEKVALLMRRNSERGTRNRHQWPFGPFCMTWTIYVENVVQKKFFFLWIWWNWD